MLGVSPPAEYATHHNIDLTYAEPGDEPGTSRAWHWPVRG